MGFLFQTGSIRSSHVRPRPAILHRFLFQTGSIRSIGMKLWSICAYEKFLFQTGSIRSLQESVTVTVIVQFLFQTGSIRSLQVFCHFYLTFMVSIPNWFD